MERIGLSKNAVSRPWSGKFVFYFSFLFSARRRVIRGGDRRRSRVNRLEDESMVQCSEARNHKDFAARSVHTIYYYYYYYYRHDIPASRTRSRLLSGPYTGTYAARVSFWVRRQPEKASEGSDSRVCVVRVDRFNSTDGTCTGHRARGRWHSSPQAWRHGTAVISPPHPLCRSRG